MVRSVAAIKSHFLDILGLAKLKKGIRTIESGGKRRFFLSDLNVSSIDEQMAFFGSDEQFAH